MRYQESIQKESVSVIESSFLKYKYCYLRGNLCVVISEYTFS